MHDSNYIHVRATTEAKKERVTCRNGTYYIDVKEKREQGKANERIRDILAEILHIPKKSLRLVKGGKQTSKTFTIIT